MEIKWKILIGVITWICFGLLMCKEEAKYDACNNYDWSSVAINFLLGPIKYVCYTIYYWIY